MLFSGPSWPQASALLDPLRQYAISIFDINAAAYQRIAASHEGCPAEVLDRMVRALLEEVFGAEWEYSPGETVLRTDWQCGPKGWTGREGFYVAGMMLTGTACTTKRLGCCYLPVPLSCPHFSRSARRAAGINVSNLEWWQYIGLKERHNFAMAIKPYLEDRVSHWQSVFTLAKSSDASGAKEVQVNAQAAVGGRISKRPARRNACFDPSNFWATSRRYQRESFPAWQLWQLLKALCGPSAFNLRKRRPFRIVQSQAFRQVRPENPVFGDQILVLVFCHARLRPRHTE